MIARIWHGKTRREHADTYREYVMSTGVREYRNTDGNLGVQIWQGDEGDFTHIWTVTLWRNLESVKKFAGAEFDKAKYYPEDRNYLVEFEPKVAHYQAHVVPSDTTDRHWRITI